MQQKSNNCQQFLHGFKFNYCHRFLQLHQIVALKSSSYYGKTSRIFQGTKFFTAFTLNTKILIHLKYNSAESQFEIRKEKENHRLRKELNF